MGKFSFQAKLGIQANCNSWYKQNGIIFETLTLSKSVYFIRKETIRENKLDNVTKNLFVSVKCWKSARDIYCVHCWYGNIIFSIHNRDTYPSIQVSIDTYSSIQVSRDTYSSIQVSFYHHSRDTYPKIQVSFIYTAEILVLAFK